MKTAAAELSLLLILATFVWVWPGLAAASDNLSVRGRYRVTVPAAGEEISVGQWQTWKVSVARLDGHPLLLKAVAIDGGMPAHGHGLPTAPEVVRGKSDAELTIQGLRFNMPGRWELRVLLADEEGTDFAVFQLDVGAAASTQHARLTWNDEERAILHSLSLASLGPVPADRGNVVSNDARAVALGHRLFFDAGLSGNQQIACATCHDPEKHFADGRALGKGVAELGRNTPSLVGAAYAGFQFWDGRRDSLWSQALGPIESSAEMNSTRLEVVHHIAEKYAHEYEALFGPLPSLEGLPRRASPSGAPEAQAAWNQLSAARQGGITRAFVNVGKAIGAYERQLSPSKSAFDRYVEAIEGGDVAHARTLLSPKAITGLKLFISSDTQCLNCHSGPLFSNQGFHNIGTANVDAAQPDFGRAIGIQALLSTEFNCKGPYNDDAERVCPELAFLDRHDENGTLIGAYKVPSLRNAAASAPYMHDGRFARLSDVIDHYRNPALVDHGSELRPLFDMTPGMRDALVQFLEALRAPLAAPPALLRAPAPE